MSPYFHRFLLVFCLFLYAIVLNAKDRLPLSNIPEENIHFTGRIQEIKEIQEKLAGGGQKIVTLSGPSGFGKSQIAKHFAHRSYENYDVIWWFKGTRYLHPQMVQLAHALNDQWDLHLDDKINTMGPERIFICIKNILHTKNLKSLMIFDDVQDSETIKIYFPSSHEKNLHILVTTRNGVFSYNTIPIKPFLRKDSIGYINKFFQVASEASKQELAQHLGDCPASIALAVDHIVYSPGMTIESYRAKYKTFSPVRLGDQVHDSPMDGYQKDLQSTIAMSLQELKKKNAYAYDMLNFLSFFHHDGIDMSYLEAWHKKRNITMELSLILQDLRRYSFLEISERSAYREVQIRMHELIHKIINDLIPPEGREILLKEASTLLLERANKRSDLLFLDIIKDTSILFHCINLSERAHHLNYHKPELTSLRIKIFDVLGLGLRDFKNAHKFQSHIESDIAAQVKYSRYDEFVYLNSVAWLAAVFNEPDYGKTINLELQALALVEKEKGMYEEKIRVVADLIETYSLTGNSDKCAPLLSYGEELLRLSQSTLYNVLFIYSASIYLIDQGKNQQIIKLIQDNEDIMKHGTAMPPSRCYLLNQLAEALIKEGRQEEALAALNQSEQLGSRLYKDRQTYHANCDILKAKCLLGTPRINQAKKLLERAIQTYKQAVGGEDRHRKQAFAHLVFGEFYDTTKDYEKAKDHYLKSEIIYDKLLKNKAIDDVSFLYKKLALLGVSLKDEALTHTYFKRHLKTFGLQHPRTQEIIYHLDSKGLTLPF